MTDTARTPAVETTTDQSHDQSHDQHFARIGIAAVAAALRCQHLPAPAIVDQTFDGVEGWGDRHHFA